MPLALAPGISFCEIDGAYIFLDRQRDRYFALSPEAGSAFATVGHRGRSEDDTARLQELVARGILVDHPYGEAPRPCRAVSITSSPLDDAPQLTAPLFAVLRTGLAIHRARFQLKLWGFARACSSVEQMGPDPRHAIAIANHELVKIAGHFAGGARLTGSFEQCLPISLAMIRFCRRRDFDAQFVVGVKTRPFQAHAWVSSRGIVLSDSSATARQFTPILIL